MEIFGEDPKVQLQIVAFKANLFYFFKASSSDLSNYFDWSSSPQCQQQCQLSCLQLWQQQEGLQISLQHLQEDRDFRYSLVKVGVL